ncbi:MAG: site-specific integrase [Armatimonadota bacterium]
MLDCHGNLGLRNIQFREVTKNASPEILEILSTAHEFLTTTVADSTKEVYSRDWRDFTRWCGEHGLPDLPSNPEVVVCYFTSLAMKGFRVTTIRRHSAAVAAAHRESGYPSPTSHSAIKELLRGMTRKLGTPPKPVDALLSEDIKKMVVVLPDSLLGVRDKAIILVGFAGAFRRSEIVGLDMENISSRDEGLAVLLPRSKSDQKGEGRWVGIPYGENPETCPVAALRRWLEASGISTGAIFRGLNRYDNIVSDRLAKRSVGEVIKRAAEAAGLDATKYSSHSLRSGHCTTASRSGVAEHIIRRQTGHRSPASLKPYLRLGRIFEENSADSLGL